MQTLLWVVLACIITIIFRKHCRAILESVKRRVDTGSAIKAGPIELGEDLRELQYVEPKPVDSPAKSLQPGQRDERNAWATERNELYAASRGVFLAHVIEPSVFWSSVQHFRVFDTP